MGGPDFLSSSPSSWEKGEVKRGSWLPQKHQLARLSSQAKRGIWQDQVCREDPEEELWILLPPPG